MIESNEPKDGDFVAYVEKLVRLPEGMRLPASDGSPGEVARRDTLRKWSAVVKPDPGREPAARHDTDPQRAHKLAELAAGSAQAWGRSVTDLFGERTGTGTAQRSASDDAAGEVFGQASSRASRAARRAAPLDVEQAARALARLVRSVGSLMVIGGLALIAASFADMPLFQADPAVGIVLTAMGAVFRRLAGRVS